MARTNTKRLYRKDGRWYVDFRDFADVGGRLEGVRPPGDRFATKDRATARRLAKARHKELKAARRRPPTESDVDLTRLGDFVDHHLVREAKETERSEQSLAILSQQLGAAIEHFGVNSRMRHIRSTHIRGFMDELLLRVGTETARKYLFALSKLFRRARADEVVPPEHDPVGVLVNKPGKRRKKTERPWLEVPEAALLLEAARLYAPKRDDLGIPYAHALVATLLLTGGRPAEVLQLEVLDVDLVRDTIKFRWSEDYRLKNESSIRVIPLWPQLKAILQAYLAGPDAPTGRFLFPSPTDADKPIRNINKLIQQLSLRIGREAVTPKIFRHTYCAARLQTMDNEKPIAQFTVSDELGHNSAQMVRDIYGHVGTVRHRSEVVEYPLEPYMLQLKPRLERLQTVSAERNAHAPNYKNRVSLEDELAIVRIAGERPELAHRMAAKILAERDGKVSESGVYWVWKRYQLNTIDLRRAARDSGRIEQLIESIRTSRN
jgi:integrase